MTRTFFTRLPEFFLHNDVPPAADGDQRRDVRGGCRGRSRKRFFRDIVVQRSIPGRQIFHQRRAVVVAQLMERSLVTLEVRGCKPVIGKLYFLSTELKRQK